jgi:thiosulfate dehydrogenase [quinone] large subunit
VTFLRVYLGYYYLGQALEKYNGDFLARPRLAAQVAEWLPNSQAPQWYRFLAEAYMIPNWQVFAFGITAVEFAIAFSFITGFLVRPMALIGLLLALNSVLLTGPIHEPLHKTFVAIHFTLAWVGAGRCLGLDYYFYKRRRGLWW